MLTTPINRPIKRAAAACAERARMDVIYFPPVDFLEPKPPWPARTQSALPG
jgi:hypothetical protein